ncbi:N-acetyltransferase DgcN [Phytohalomonas tamaricis]|uniref:N-acetyltransferase DgcN n=1 Tax=Phytohalomonas tamaricis TaxID=2081032 RepID=UPI000D0B6D54|nr:N-acetyltransferase DgcN [Phytohalomonas tamaricis]
MQIPQPYLLFLGDVRDPLAVKMARGILAWRPEACVGQLRLDAQTPDLGLDDLTVAEAAARGARTMVIGTANAGGKLPIQWLDSVREAVAHGMNVASGMHQRLGAVEDIAAAARGKGVELFDVRHVHPPLEVGNGARRPGKRVLSVGTDCSVGKMFTALALEAELKKRGIDADFRATGQSGIMIAGEGIAIDAVIADFISGAVEQLTPANDTDHWDVIEGQGSLLNPAYAGVSMGLIHGAQPDYLIMCHELGRPHMRHMSHFPVPDINACVELNLTCARVTNPAVRLAGFSVNTSSANEEEARTFLQELERRFGVPATDPVRFGIEKVASHLLALDAQGDR